MPILSHSTILKLNRNSYVFINNILQNFQNCNTLVLIKAEFNYKLSKYIFKVKQNTDFFPKWKTLILLVIIIWINDENYFPKLASVNLYVKMFRLKFKDKKNERNTRSLF